MKPKIQATKFGSITIQGQKTEHDVIIRLDGSVKKRKKKLSSANLAHHTAFPWPRLSMCLTKAPVC